MAGRISAIESEEGFPFLEDAEHLAPEVGSQEPVLRDLVRVFHIYRRAYLCGVIAVVAVAVVLAFLLPQRYRATGSLMASGSGMPDGPLGRLARMANLGTSRDPLAPEALCSILRSRRISDPILDKSFACWPDDAHPLPLKNILSRTRPGKEPPREKLYRRLGRAARFGMDPETRIVTLAVETRYPYLSAQVANAYLETLSQYITEEHQSRSRLEGRTIGNRLAEVRQEIEVEEKRLHAFYSANQNYATSSDPGIRIEQLRLERSLELQARVMIELVSQQEAALIEERNEAPAIRVIDRGSPPELHCWPQRRLLVGGALAGALIVGFVLMLLADHLGIGSHKDVPALPR